MSNDVRLHCVLRDKDAVGFILSAGPKGYRAYSEAGQPLGLFESEHDAAKAVYQRHRPA
jgi:hypothetical protein